MLNSQAIVTLNPPFPTADDAVTITFDAAQGNKGLADLPEGDKVYAHTGLTVNGQNWRHVVGNWGQDDGKGLMTRVGNSNIYTLQVTPGIREWYSANSGSVVPGGAEISQICLVFRNANGSREGKTASNGDIFIPIATDVFVASITSHPESNLLVMPGQNITFTGQSSAIAELSFTLNGNPVTSASDTNRLDYELIANDLPSGIHTLIFIAVNDGTTRRDTILLTKHTATTLAPIPAGREEGISYPDPSTVYLQLRAPHKEFIYVLGDFNNWTFLPSHMMKKDPGGQFFWVEISGLDPGREYRFQYSIDQTGLRVTDPYCEKILDPSNDSWIPSSTYPDLLSYPTGKAEGIVGVLQSQKPAYQWDNSYTYTRPPKEDLIVYELLVRDFDSPRTFASVIDKLPYFADLGINAIELMPVSEFEGNDSWGYNPSFFMAVDKAYGPANELKRLVDSCHRRGIAVISDVVLNHAFGLSPMVRMYFDPQAGQWGRPSAQNPWFNPVAKHAFNVGYDFNHESPATKFFCKKVLQHWINEYKIDGYRFDLSKGFTQNQTCDNNGGNCNVGAWGNYDQSRIDILKDYAAAIRVVDPGSFIILEHFADWNEEWQLANDGMMLWAKGTDIYNEATMGYGSNPYNNTIQRRGWHNPPGPQNYGLVAYMESHDEERLMYKNLQHGNASGEYTIRDLNTALDRISLAACFFIPLPSAKMIWQFGELGYDFSINRCPNGTISENCRTGVKPVRWDYFDNIERRKVYDTFRKLNYLKTHYTRFRDLNHHMDVGSYNKVLKFTGSDINVVIAGNFNVVGSQITPHFPFTGKWYDYLTGDSITIHSTDHQFSYAPGEYHVYLDRKVVPPPSTLPPPTAIQPVTAANLEVYPNPFDQTFTVRLPVSGEKAVIELLDLSGRVVHRAVSGGDDRLAIPASFLAPGVYLCRVQQSSGNIYMNKIIKQ